MNRILIGAALAAAAFSSAPAFAEDIVLRKDIPLADIESICGQYGNRPHNAEQPSEAETCNRLPAGRIHAGSFAKPRHGCQR